MLALLGDVPFLNNPVVRIVLGAALIAAAVLALHHNLILIVIGAFIVVMGLVRGASSLTGHHQR